MTDREKDAWIALNVVGWTRGDVKPGKWFPDGAKNTWLNPKGALDSLPLFTVSPSAALSVLKKCAEKIDPESSGILVWTDGKNWTVEHQNGAFGKAPTLEQAICDFAIKLYGGTV